MKKLFYFVLPSALLFTSCNMASDSDYESMSNDMCECTNTNTANISKETKDAIVETVKSGKSMEEAMTKLAMKNPEQTMEDGQNLMAASAKIENCIKSLETKYENIYTKESQSEVMDRLIETLKLNKSCEFTYAMIQMGKMAAGQ
jgi:hypothetical protein